MTHPKRKRDRIKQLFGLSSRDTSPASRPHRPQSSASPTPQTLSHAATPQRIDKAPLPPVADGPARETNVDDAPTGEVPSVSVSPHGALADQAPITNPSNLQPSSTGQQKPSEANPGRVNSVAWSGLKTLLKMVEASADAFPPLKSAVGGLNQCINIFERAAKGRNDYEKLGKELDSLAGDLARFLSDRANVKMTNCINNLSTAINQELKIIKEKSGRGVVEKHAEALEDADGIMECYQRIRGHLDRLTLNANLEIWSAVNHLTEGLRDTRLQRLSPSLAALYDSAKSSIVQRRRCTPGTRIPEIDKLITWAHNPQGQNVFWMNGMAGTGKTTIAYSVCAELDEKAALGASFFCSRSIPECRDASLIIPAIAYQLAQFSYPFRCAVSEVLETESDVYARVLEKQFDSLLVKPLQDVKHTLPEGFVVVIDALDECEDKDIVAKILRLLLPQTNQSALPIRFILSSRPEPEIYSHMMKQLGDSVDSRLVLHNLETQAVKQDIKTYLQDELAEVHLTQPQLAELVDCSGVLFIFASTAARYIKDGIQFHQHEERLGIILGLSPNLDIDQNQDIDRLYATILGAAFTRKGVNQSIREKMETTLSTIICVQEPMTVGSLAGLLRLRDATLVDALLRPFCSVIDISEANGLVTTLHASFPDYMLDKKRSSSFHCSPIVNHTRLAQACFSLLQNNHPQFNICSLGSSYALDKDAVRFEEYAKEAVPSQLLYSCRHGVSHVELGNAAEMEPQMFDFLSRRLLLWMEVLNVQNSTNQGPDIMRRVEILSRSNSYSTETVELAHDAWRFIMAFAIHPTSQSTPHIYISLLPYWPESAPITRYYGTKIRSAVTAQGTAMTRRHLDRLATFTFDQSVQCVCFSADSSLIALGAGASAYVVDGNIGTRVAGPLNHSKDVWSVAFSPDGTMLASGGEDKLICVWSTSTGQATVDPMTEHTNKITSVCFTPDGARIVSGSYDWTIRVWNWRDNIVLGPFKSHVGWVRSVCVSPDGTRIVSGCDDCTVRVWDTESGQMALGPLVGHGRFIRSVCFSPDGSRIVSGSDDRTIRIWSAQTGQQLGEPLKGHTDYVRSVTFSPDGSQLVSGSEDKTIRLWNADGTLESVQQFDGHTHYVNSVAFSSDGTRILSCSRDKTVRVWDARSKAVVDTPLEAHTQGVSSVCFSHDGTRILSASSDATVRVWDARGGSPLLKPLTGHSNQRNCARFSPDGTRIAAGSADHTIQLWDSETGQSAGESLAGHSKDVAALCFSPDGALVASGSYDNTIRVWSTQTRKMTTEPLTGHTDRVWSVCFSPDSTRVVSSSEDKTVRVWGVITGQLALGPLVEHTNAVYCVCFSPDGTRIASASWDRTIRLWDSSTGRTMCDPFKGHNGGIVSVCFSPTGEFIASGSDDKTIRLWDAHTGVAIGVLLTGHTGLIRSVAFSPDGSQIVSGSWDATIRVFDVSDLSTLRSKATSSSPSDEDPDALTFACQPWVLQEDGWVVDTQSRLLAWVPLDLHTRLLRPRCTLLISATGSVKIDLDYDKLGEGWAGCYKP